MKAWVVVVAFGAAAAAVVGAWWLISGDDQSPELASGEAIYAQQCANCHGANLEGQPDWQTRLANGRMPAPPHDETGHTWHHSDQQLFQIVKDGLAAIIPDYETDMPAFAGILSDQEILAVLAYIESTWPDRERRVQAERTAADPREIGG